MAAETARLHTIIKDLEYDKVAAAIMGAAWAILGGGYFVATRRRRSRI